MIRELVTGLLAALLGMLRSRTALLAENALLRQQLIGLHRAAPHPRLKARDRLAISAATKLFPSVLAAVAIVRPEAVLRWHRSIWKLLWCRRSRRPAGRPPIDAEARALIRRMWKENPLWGEDRIAAELAKLGHHVTPRTVAKYRPARLPRGRGQKWSAFIRNHLGQTWAADWFTIVTLRFQVLYAFVILDLGRREVVRLGVTPSPSAQYTAQSFVEAVCDRGDRAPRFLIHDRDSIYGVDFRRRVKGFGTRCLVTPPRAPQANPYAERLGGSLRRECLDHVIVLGESHLDRIIKSYLAYYHKARTHLSLGKDAPEPRPVHLPSMGKVVALPEVGGLHHRYERLAA